MKGLCLKKFFLYLKNLLMPENECKNCGNRFTGKYCNVCGEKVYTEKDKSIKYIIEEGFHFLTHFEGTFLKSLKAIITRPGTLSLDYCNGIRKKYFKPLIDTFSKWFFVSYNGCRLACPPEP